MLSRRLALALALLLYAASAMAAAPALSGVSPRGLRRGQVVRITLTGDGVGGPGAEVRATFPGTIGPATAEGPNQVRVDATIPADAPVGFFAVRVRTDDGLSTPLAVSVGDLADTPEAEPNDEPAGAQTLALPAVVFGMCAGADRDRVRFEARKGDRLVIEVEARRLGSGLDPALTVLDATGRAVSSDSDAVNLAGDLRLVFSPPADGIYSVALNDMQYAGGGNPFYRLKIGRFACADAVFPLGWRRGDWVEAHWLGGSLPGPSAAKVRLPEDPALAWAAPAPPATGTGPAATAPPRLVLSDLPERVEPEGTGPHPLAVGTVMNGRIGSAGEVDAFRVPVRPGQPLSFELTAARLGSRLDAVLTLARPDGAVLAEADDVPGRGFDPTLAYDPPADAQEVLVTVRDLLGRGGPSYAYRLLARASSPDFELRVASPAITIRAGAVVGVPVQVIRRNFNDPIQLSAEGPGLVGVRASGGAVPAGGNDGLLLLSAAPGAPPRMVDLEVWGTSGTPAQPIRRRARLATDGTPMGTANPSELAAAIGSAPAITLASAEALALVHGEPASLVVRASRPAGNAEPIALSAAGLPAGQVAGGTATIAADQSEVALPFTVTSTAPLGPRRLTITAQYKSAGRDEVVILPPIAAEVVRPFSLEVLTPSVSVVAGSRVTVQILVRRNAPFTREVRVGIGGSLPPSVIALPASAAPGVVVLPIEVTVGPNAPPGSYDLVLQPATDTPDRKQTKDYLLPELTVKVAVTAK